MESAVQEGRMSLVSMGLRPAVHMARHLKTGKVYRILAEGIDRADPDRKVVVYEQLHDYIQPEAGVMVPRGTVWVQDKKSSARSSCGTRSGDRR